MKKMLSKFALILMAAIMVPVLVWQQVSFWSSVSQRAKADDAQSIQSDISDVQKKLEKEKKAQEKLQQNLGQIKTQVASTQQQISKTQTAINQTADNISRKERDLQNLNDKMDLQKQMLASFLQQTYYIQNQPALNVVMAEGDFAKLFSDTDHYATLNDKISGVISDIQDSQAQIEQDKAVLADMKQQQGQVLAASIDQKQGLLVDQAATQSDIADKQKTIDKLNKELNQLQGDLNTLLGKSYSAKNIMDAVNFASDKTGVPEGFLIGVLKMETNLGANTGGCTYGQVESGAQDSYKAGKLSKTAWNTFQTRRTIFKTIADELNLDYEKQKVSCNPKGYTGTGGAMGVAQFMPDTWMGYKSQVASYTGNNPPSPWNLGDGVMAMALKLRKTPGVTDGKTSAFKSAACSYLGTCYAPYVNGILYWADNYKDLID